MVTSRPSVEQMIGAVHPEDIASLQTMLAVQALIAADYERPIMTESHASGG